MVRRNQTVLIIDDDEALLPTLARSLELAGYDVLTAREHVAGMRLLENQRVDALLLDLNLPGVEGFEALEAIHAAHPTLPIIMNTAFADVPKAVQATRIGAFDFLEKSGDRERLLLIVRNACERSRLEAERLALLRSLQERNPMIGESKQMTDLLRLIARVAPTEERVLIIGETGTGKELVAEAIQVASRRAGKPFVKVNCAAIPKDLIESKLFGHRKGAFTGATDNAVGEFKLADTGTLFLDEIGDMDISAQAKVLRAIQEGEIEPVGGKGREKVDVRILAATNKDLEELVKAGRFREDLYYRINTFMLRAPPLRERLDDIRSLMAVFLSESAAQNNQPVLLLSAEALQVLMQYDWPGNVRELKSCAAWLSIFASGPEVTTRDARQWLGEGNSTEILSGTYLAAREQFERDYFSQLLKTCDHNISAAARIADLDRSGLHRKLKSLGLSDS